MDPISAAPPQAFVVWSNDGQVRHFNNEKMAVLIDKMMRHHKACSLVVAEKFTLTYYRTLISKNVELTEVEKDVLITGFLQYADAEGDA